MNKNIILALGLTATLFASCKKDKDDPIPMEIPYGSLTATTDYFATFKDSSNNTTVDFSGQTTRIKMMKEMDAYMKTALTSTVDAGILRNMFFNENSPFTNPDLNAATDKKIAAKTAQSFGAAGAGAEQQLFLDYFDALSAASAHHGDSAKQGIPGHLDGKYIVDAKGFEYAQFIQKGLIGAMMLDQISNIYLGTEKQSADNNTLVSGKNYTQLEHHWDEAYGYLTSNAYYPMKDPNDATKWLESYLGSYVRQVGSPYGNPQDVYMAFLKGRAAIVNNDNTTRTQQITAIRTALEKAVATVAVSYLNKTKSASSNGARFHALSEGVGFIYSLRYAYAPKIDKAKSDALLDILMNKQDGFWSLTNADLDSVRNQIADAFGIDREAIVNH